MKMAPLFTKAKRTVRKVQSVEPGGIADLSHPLRMKTYTPQISWHDRQPILSVDIQNRVHSQEDGLVNYRLATGGNDSHVIIWKASRDLSDSPKPIEAISCLAELTQHQKAVNVVRFSPNLDDNLLASGDDDSLIFIWKLCEEEDCSKSGVNEKKLNDSRPDIFNDSDVITIETWKTYKILRGHNQDVSDLCWSKDGQNLVSGSVDNFVFVWDVHRGVKLHRLAKEHSNYVQGVTWDPLNKYICSLSADRSLIIFKTKNGKTLHKISKMTFTENSENMLSSSKLFYDHTLMSFCRRLAFSPGGELLFAPSGILEISSDKFENTVYVFDRKTLNRPTYYLPTNKFSVAVKCCPVIFELRKDIDENVLKFPYRIVFVVATEDSLLFYDSQQMSPFAYVSQIHYLRLTDLSWSSDGQVLIVTSTDGFSSFIVFGKDEFGTPYQGKLLEFEEPEEVKVPKSQIKAKNVTPKVVKPPVKLPTNPPATPITSFFKKTSPSSKGATATSESPRLTTDTSESKNQAKQGRRVSLITLFTSNQEKRPTESSIVNDEEDHYETGIKRKLVDNVESTDTPQSTT